MVLKFSYSRSCNCCGSTDTMPVIFNVRDILHTSQLYKIYKCRNCQLLFTYPKLVNKDQSFLYAHNYFSSTNGMTSYEKFYRFHQYSYDIHTFAQYLLKSYSLLDYGCGDGTRIEHLVKHGYEMTFGIDLYDNFTSAL